MSSITDGPLSAESQHDFVIQQQITAYSETSTDVIFLFLLLGKLTLLAKMTSSHVVKVHSTMRSNARFPRPCAIRSTFAHCMRGVKGPQSGFYSAKSRYPELSTGILEAFSPK